MRGTRDIPDAMYQLGEPTGPVTVPAFLSKLWTLVEDPNYDHLIRWDETGQSFHVYEQAQFAKEVLPLYFKHSNIASFIRQLNMYGFRKVMNVDQGGLKSEKDDLEFQHPYFLRGEEHLLEHIKRKVHKPYEMVSVKPVESMNLNPSDISKVLTDITTLKGKQDNMNTKLENMKRENEALWREVANLRQRHSKQQQIIDKLIGFLVTLVGGNRRPGLKRKMPLMLPDASQVAAKSAKLSKQFSIDDSRPEYTVQSPQSAASPGQGPIIHDVTDFILPDNDTNKDQKSDAITNATLGNAMYSMPEKAMFDVSVEPKSSAPQPEQDSRPSPQSNSENSKSNNFSPPSRYTDINSEISHHLDGMQIDINNLKDILASPTYNLDPNLLIGLFDGDNPLSPHIPSDVSGSPNPLAELSPSTSSVDPPELPVGNELVQYTPIGDMPTLLDLADDSNNLLCEDGLDTTSPFIDLDLTLNTPLPLDDTEYRLPNTSVSPDDLD